MRGDLKMDLIGVDAFSSTFSPMTFPSPEHKHPFSFERPCTIVSSLGELLASILL